MHNMSFQETSLPCCWWLFARYGLTSKMTGNKHILIHDGISLKSYGNGSGIIKPLCRLARGVWTPSGLETMLPSVTTKYCVLAALCLFFIPSDATYVAVAGLFLSMKVGPLFGVPVDFFSPLENKISPLVLGVPEQEQKKTK